MIVQAGASESGTPACRRNRRSGVHRAAATSRPARRSTPTSRAGCRKLGRNPEHMKIMPACFVVVGDTVEEAQSEARQARQPGRTTPTRSPRCRSRSAHDASKFDPDGPLPDESPRATPRKSGRERAIALGKRENLTVRQLAQRIGGYSAASPWSARRRPSPTRWRSGSTTKALSDGFTIHVPVSARRARRFLSRGVVPELQRRGLFRTRIRGQDAAREPRPAAAGATASSIAASPSRRNNMSEIENFHAHVYYDAPTRAQALQALRSRRTKVRRQGRADARQSGRPASARQLPAHHRQGAVHRRGVVAGAQPQAA